jgi:hypothetical protein
MKLVQGRQQFIAFLRTTAVMVTMFVLLGQQQQQPSPGAGLLSYRLASLNFGGSGRESGGGSGHKRAFSLPLRGSEKRDGALAAAAPGGAKGGKDGGVSGGIVVGTGNNFAADTTGAGLNHY